MIVDARSAVAYGTECIPAAINLPHRTLSNAVVRQLDTNKLYVCYYDSVGSDVSTKGAFCLAALGPELVELMGGLEGWKRDG